jgi:HK97 family phage major capsid protein/HK97 family phage prohead protease
MLGDNEYSYDTVAEYVAATHGGDRQEAVLDIADRVSAGMDAAQAFKAHRQALESQRLELHAQTMERMVMDIPLELAQAETKGNKLRGYASVFNHPIDIGGSRVPLKEFVRPGAFTKTLKEDRDQIQVLFNHGLDARYGSLPIGTLTELREDKVGLWAEVQLHDGPDNQNIRSALASGSLRAMSIQFETERESFNDERNERYLEQLKLYELGPVTFPANSASTATLHSIEIPRQKLASDERKAEALTTRIEEVDGFLRDVERQAERLKAEHEATEHQRQRWAPILSGGTSMEDHDELSAWLRHGGTTTHGGSGSTFDVQLRSPGVERHDLTKGASPGSELIPTGFSRIFFQALSNVAAVRQTGATVMTTTSGESLLVPKSTAYGTANLIAEGASITEVDPTFAQVSVSSYKYAAFMQASREVVEDSAFDVSSFIAKAFGESVGLAVGAAYVTGTGSAQPQGITNAGTAGVTLGTGQTTTITSADSLMDLFFSVLPQYRVNGVWILNDTTLAIVRKFKATTNDYIWQSGLATGTPDTLLGRPVVVDSFMPVPAANALTIGFGDFSRYFTIRDAAGLRIERSDDFAFQNDLVSYRAIFRTDSKQIINGASGAVKFLKQSAT